MDNNKLTKAELAVMAYAKNRADLREVNKEIQGLINPSGDFISIDLNPAREAWINETKGGWEGWGVAVAHYDELGNSELALKLAMFLDRKTELRRQAGQLKRNICSIGAALNRKASK